MKADLIHLQNKEMDIKHYISERTTISQSAAWPRAPCQAGPDTTSGSASRESTRLLGVQQKFHPGWDYPPSSPRGIASKPPRTRGSSTSTKSEREILLTGNPLSQRVGQDLRSPRVGCVMSSWILSPSEKRGVKAQMNSKDSLPGGRGGLLCPLLPAT